MYVSVNKVYVFPVTIKEAEGKAIIFETSSLGRGTNIMLSDINSLGLVKLTDGVDEEPMPRFGDIIYTIFNAKLDDYSLAADPKTNRIVIFSTETNGQLEISYQKSNDEYRFLSTPGFEEVSRVVREAITPISDRIVEFQYIARPQEEVMEEEHQEEEKEGSLLDGVSELEKMYVESGRDTEEVPKSE